MKILLGKDSGKVGKVEYVLAKEKRVFVAGANIYKRHVRKTQGIEGGIINIPKSMDISNVALICPSCKKVTRVGYKITGKDLPVGRQGKTRVCKKCQKEIIHPSKGGKS